MACIVACVSFHHRFYIGNLWDFQVCDMLIAGLHICTHTHTHTQWAHRHQSQGLSAWKQATPTHLLATRAHPSLPAATQPRPPLLRLTANSRWSVAGQTKHPLEVCLPANGHYTSQYSKQAVGVLGNSGMSVTQ